MSGTDDFQTFVREALGGLAGQIMLQLGSRIEAIDARLDGIGARLDRIEARLDGLGARLDRIEARLDGLEARLDGMEARQAHAEVELAKTRADIMDRIDRLQTHMDSVRQDITVNMGAAAAATNSVRNIRTDYENLYDMVMTMHRQQMRLTSQVEELSRRNDPPH